MSLVPISMADLELIVSDCARDLIEKWAIEGEISEENISPVTHKAIDITAFVIDKFMGYMNNLMEEKEKSFG